MKRRSDSKLREPRGIARRGLLLPLLVLGSAVSVAAQGVPTLRLPPQVAEFGDSLSFSGLGFGRIAGAVPVGTGMVAVVDDRLGSVFQLDVRRRSVESVGGFGSGPAEFRVPIGVWAIGPTEFAVADIALERVTFMTLRGASFEPTRSFRFQGGLHDGCAWRGHGTMLRGVYQQRMLHLYDSTGTLQRSVGEPFPAPSPLAVSSLNRGPMVCSPARDLVLVASSLLGRVRAVDSGGRLIWESRIKGFRPVEMIVHESAFGFRQPPGGYQRIASMFLMTDDVLALQLGLEDAEHPEPAFAEIETVFLDARTGRELGRERDAPLVVSSGFGTYVILTVKDDVPMVRVLRNARSAR
jgi:hypothetical protein